MCATCDNELFNSRQKFEHSSPWPAFTEPIRPDSISKTSDPEMNASRNALKVN